MNLGKRIYDLRTKQNMSQGDLADALEVSRQSVSKWENNSAVPELDKLIKMSRIFGITIDELVSGEEKQQEQTAPPPPQSVPVQSVPGKPGLTPQQILGIVLLSFGALCLIVFTVVGIFVGAWLMGLAIGLPFLLCGAVCLVCKNNIGLKCGWCVYLPIWILCTIVIVRTYGTMQYVAGGGLLIAGAALTVITIRRMKNGQIVVPRWGKALLSIAMIAMLVITLLGMLPSPEVDVVNPFITEETHIVTPADPSETTKATQ